MTGVAERIMLSEPPMTRDGRQQHGAGSAHRAADQIAAAVIADGFALVRATVAAPATGILAAGLEEAIRARGPGDPDAVSSQGTIYAFHVDRVLPRVRDIATADVIADAVSTLLGTGHVLVRATFFDKHPNRRWALPWHRDIVFGVVGEARWRAPRRTLESMLAVRLHLDDADEANGCLLVAPGSHTGDGTLSAWPPVPLTARQIHPVIARAGDALLMRPLLLHRSARPTDPGRHRRVLHVDLAAIDALPAGQSWA